MVRNTGRLFPATVHVTDTLPSGLAYVPGSLIATSGIPNDSSAPTLKWSGVMSATPVVTVAFAVSVVMPNTAAIMNTAAINPGYGAPFARTVSLSVNPYQTFLPVILLNN